MGRCPRQYVPRLEYILWARNPPQGLVKAQAGRDVYYTHASAVRGGLGRHIRDQASDSGKN